MMSRRFFLTHYWGRLSITTKFTVSFAVLLVLIGLMALTSFLTLTTVRRQTETAISTSIQTQTLVLEMDETLQNARRLERDFFRLWPDIGLAAARQDYAEAHQTHITTIIDLSEQLQQRVATSNVSQALQNSQRDLVTYVSLINLYATSFDESVALIDELGTDGSGRLARLEQHSGQLQADIEATADAGLIALFFRIKSFEKEYLFTRQRPKMQQAFNSAVSLREAIDNHTILNSTQKEQILADLATYETAARNLIALDNQIRTLRNSFDLQATAVEPISDKLINLVNNEVEATRRQINQTSSLASAILVVMIIAAVILTILIAMLLNKSITRNVIKLTEAAVQLQQGKLQTRAKVDSFDELGQLADTFNLLSTRIAYLVNNLEAEAAEAQTRLLEAIESISEGFSLYDANDRLVLYNSKYREMYGQLADTVRKGTLFTDIIQAAAERGYYLSAVGRVEDWVSERLHRHQNPRGAQEHELATGRWIQINEYQTERGDIFGIHTDITDHKLAEVALLRQNNYLEALHNTTFGLLSHLNLNELLEDIIHRAGQLLGTDHGYIYLAEAEGTELARKVGAGIYSQSLGFNLLAGEGLAGKVYQTGQPLHINNCHTWAGRSPNINYDGIYSMAGVPLKSGSKVDGVIGMAYDVETGQEFDNNKVELLSRFAQLASLALDNARLYTTAQEEKERSDNLLNVVIPIGVALSAEQDFDRLMEKILVEAKSFCNADAGTLYLKTDNDELDFVIVRNDLLNIAMGGASGQKINFPPISLYNKDTGQPNHSNVAAHVALTGETINIPNAYRTAGFNFTGTKEFDKSTGYRSTSFLTIPLKNIHNNVVGVLQLINALDQVTGRIIPFDRTLEQIATSLSSLATVALEAYIREQNLRQQIQQLKIEIDEVKRQQQVSEIIETDFFQDLQIKARNIRRRQNKQSGKSE